MTGPLRSLVILGGGTAGWMAAASLSHFLKPLGVAITLIESEAIGAVGVGEATIPPIMNFIRSLGMDEDEIVRACRATFKLGIAFRDWTRLGHSYLHPFGATGFDMQGVPFYSVWRKARVEGRADDFDAYSLMAQAIKKGRFMRPSGARTSPLHGVTYALHLDASLFAQCLRRFAEARGVRRVEGRVANVALHPETGFIERLDLENGARVDGDFFIDCSGFRGLLIEEALKTGYEDWTRWLPCDRAVAVQSASDAPPPPHTLAVGREAGWQWRIPLQHRTGNGHVFCSAMMDNDAATRILLDHLDGAPLNEPRVIGFVTGRRKSTWVKNCVALGLASGFMEPLESTSIHLVQSVMTRFLEFFPDADFNPVEIAEFNRRTRREYELIRDFLVLHYHANGRDEPFWRERRAAAIPDSLAHKLDYFRQHGRLLVEEGDLFREASWAQVLIGQGVLPAAASPMTGTVGAEALSAFMNGLKETQARAMAAMPSHADFIARHCAAS